MLWDEEIITTAALTDATKKAKLDALIDRVKTNPALEAYFIADELETPRWFDLAKLVDYIRKRDPAHLCYVNLLCVYGVYNPEAKKSAAVYRRYVDTFVQLFKPQFLSYDTYALLKWGDLERYFMNLELVRDAAVKNNLPFMNIIQASTYSIKWRFPNAKELRWQVYTSLAYGARGISYFLYWGSEKFGGIYRDCKPTAAIKPVAQLNSEIAALSLELMKRHSLGVYHAPNVMLPLETHPVPPTSPEQVAPVGEYVIGLFGSDSTPDAS